MQSVLQLLKCHSVVLAWGKSGCVPFCLGKQRGVMEEAWKEARSSATNLLPSRSFPFFSQAFPCFPSLSHFSDFLKMKAFCFYLSFALSALTVFSYLVALGMTVSLLQFSCC